MQSYAAFPLARLGSVRYGTARLGSVWLCFHYNWCLLDVGGVVITRLRETAVTSFTRRRATYKSGRPPSESVLRQPESGTSGPPPPTKERIFSEKPSRSKSKSSKKWCLVSRLVFIYILGGRRAVMTLPVTTLIGQSVEGSRLTSRFSNASARLEPGLR